MNLHRLNLNGLNFYVLNFCLLISGYLVNVCYSKILTNSYLVEFVKDTDRALADQIALRHGFFNAGPVSLKFIFKKKKYFSK